MGKETRITLAKVGGSMMSLGFSVFSAVADAKGLAPSVPWKWLTPVAIVVFAVFVYWGWASISLRLRRLEDTRPTVEVAPRREHTRAGIRVTNKGQHEAKFAVHVLSLRAEGLMMTHVGRDLEHIVPYDARWKEYLNKPEYPLKADDFYDIELLKTDGEVEEKRERKERLEIYTANETHQSTIPFDTDIKVVVKVVSEPKLKTPLESSYLLHFDQNGCWDRFEEVQ
jgi:hypothetical protein